MQYNAYTISPRPENEDIYVLGDGWVAILDGATNLGKKSKFNANWFVTVLKEELEKEMPKLEQSLEICLAKAVASTASLAPPGFNDVSASVILLRQEDENLECYTLGDCTAVAFFRDGSSQVLYETNLEVLDQISIDLTVEVTKREGISMEEAVASPEVQKKLLEHRQLKNTPEGYYTCDPQGSGVPFGRKYRYPLEEVSHFLLMTDGFAETVVTFKMYPDYPKLLEAIQESSLEVIAKELFRLQEEDKEMQTCPRLKVSDDTTAIHVFF